jgi:hypothetical protein
MTDKATLAVLLVTAFVLLVPQAQAGAADKGSFFASGQLGFNYFLKSGSPEDSPSEGLALNLTPRLLYFPVNGIGVGGEANFSSYSDGYKQSSLAIGPRVAYYLKMNRSRYPHACCMTPWFGMGTYWMPFAGLSLMYLSDRYEYGGSASTASGYRARLGVGAAPMIGDRGTMFFELGFQTQGLKSGSSATQTSNQIYLEGGFGAFLFKDKD